MNPAFNPDAALPASNPEAPALPAAAGPDEPGESAFSPRERASMETWEGPDGASVRPAQVVVTQDPLLFELSALLQEEAGGFLQQGSNSMAVALQAADGTEVLAHFTGRSGALEVVVRCEPLDLARLQAFWPNLARVLSPRMQLAPLCGPPSEQEGPVAASPCPSTDGRRFRRPGWQKSA